MPASLICAAAFAASLGAVTPPECEPARAAGVIERYQTAPSAALGRPVRYTAYRPAAAPENGRRWPVIYLLEGRPAESDWLDQGFVYEAIDKAVAAGAIPPTLVVIPSAPFSWYVDNPDPGGAGPIETAMTRDLVAAVDARYPTAACREGRAIGGVSMGGFGALNFALDRPDQYVAAMSFAGALAAPIAAGDGERLRRAEPFYDGAFGRPMSPERFNRENPFTKIWAPVRSRGPKPAVLLAVGDQDRAALTLGAARLHADLRRAGFESALRIGPGAHNWETWSPQLAEALEWLGPKLDPSCGGGAGVASAPLPAPDATTP